MESLDDLSFIYIISQLRPSDIIELGIVNKTYNLLTQQSLVIYQLLKRWYPTTLTVDELIQKFPNITLSQISMLADYYYPTKDSLKVWDANELFYNACKAGYSVSDCMQFKGDIHMVYSAIAVQRNDIIEHLYKLGIFSNFFSGNYDGYITMLMHRDIDITTWVNTIIKYGANKSYVASLFNKYTAKHNYIVGYLLESNHVDLHRLANHFGVDYKPMKCGIHSSSLTAYILRYKLGLPVEANILSTYNSENFPSTDILNDLCSRNYVEVVRKAGEYNIVELSDVRRGICYITPVGISSSIIPLRAKYECYRKCIS